MKVVSVSGFGYSGSSAVTDLLKEYSDINVIGNREFQIFDPPDGIRDLENHINQECYYINHSIAIRRFLTFMKHNRFMDRRSRPVVDKYLSNFIEIKWRGRTGFEKGLLYGPSYVAWLVKRGLDEIYSRIFHRYSNILNTDFYLSKINPDFNRLTRDFVDEYLKSYGADETKVTVVDQLFPGIAPSKYFDYVNDPYCIVVDRDPRDVYLEAKRMNVNLIPLDSVEDFVTYFKLTRPKHIPNDRVLFIQFEDLIYKYDETVKQIENFLNVKDHSSAKCFFNPDKSQKNTGLYKKFSNHKEIKKIQEELKDYLYK